MNTQQSLNPGPDSISRVIGKNTSFDFGDGNNVQYNKKQKIFTDVFWLNTIVSLCCMSSESVFAALHVTYVDENKSI